MCLSLRESAARAEAELAEVRQPLVRELRHRAEFTKEICSLRDQVARATRERDDLKGRLEIATADRVLAQRALAELVLRFCSKMG